MREHSFNRPDPLEGRAELESLLKQAGAILRGARFDCPKCESKRSVNILPPNARFDYWGFYCHKDGCEWRGNARTLQKELGMAQEPLPREEWLKRRREHEHLTGRISERKRELDDQISARERQDRGMSMKHGR